MKKGFYEKFSGVQKADSIFDGLKSKYSPLVTKYIPFTLPGLTALSSSLIFGSITS